MKSRKKSPVNNPVEKVVAFAPAGQNCSRRLLRGTCVCVDALEPRQLMTSVVVNTVVDATFPQGSGLVSLRNAIATADANGSPTTITFDPAVFATAQTIQMNGIVLNISNATQAITITGPAAGLTLDAGNLSGVFTIGSGTVSMYNLTATDANTSAIVNSGTLTMQNCTLSNSGFNGLRNGGGLLNNTTATLTNCTISGNSAFVGGGIDNNYGVLTLIGDTFSGNTASGWAGVWYADGAAIDSRANATLINDTFSGNQATYTNGSIIHTYGTMSMDNCTVATNTGAVGISNGSGSSTAFVVTNSIIANNGTTGDATGQIDSLGYNDIGNIAGSSGWNALDLKGVLPSLGALANNGGPTKTMLPLAGSPVIDAGLNAYVPSGTNTDQRGLPRFSNIAVDIGAVEVNPKVTTSTVIITSGTPVTYGQSVTLTATVTPSTIAGATGSVQFMDGSNSLGSPVSVNSATGVATYTTSTLAVGNHSIVAVYGGDSSFAGSTSTPLIETVNPVPAVVGAPEVNADNALAGLAQRSTVTSIVYTFSQAVNIAASGAFVIAVTSGQTGTLPTLSWAPVDGTANPDGSSTLWTVSFTGSGTVSGSIGNGVYDITVVASAVTAAGGGSPMTANRTDTFWRLYGDNQGTGTVNTIDKGKFNLAFGTSAGASTYLAAFDSNLNNTIDSIDKGRFNLNYGITYTGFTATI